MDWTDTGTVLHARGHGESSAIVQVFTAGHGLHAGVVRGATSRKLAPVLQPGTQVSATWRARLEEHLGTLTLEPLHSRAAAVMSGRAELAGLNAIASLLIFCLPEREPHPRLYARTIALLDMIGVGPLWPIAYLHWELALLEEMGFGLDLSACAVTGATSGLVYVSPKTGRAVSGAGAGDWSDRLLPLPDCLREPREASAADLAQALRTTGYFLHNRLAPALGDKPLPAARQRLLDLLARQSRA